MPPVVRTVTRVRSSVFGRRSFLAAAVLLLAACRTGGPEPANDRAPVDDLRARLAAALRDNSPTQAALVEDGRTALTPTAVDWLPGWRIVDVISSTPPHPRRFFAALPDEGYALVLTGSPERFSALLVDAGVRVESADVATGVATLFLDSTRDFRAYAYRVDRVEDIEWRPQLSAAEQATRDEVVAGYGDQVKPAYAESNAGGWRVEVWMVSGQDLVRHELGIATGRPVSDRAETVARGIPVPYSA